MMAGLLLKDVEVEGRAGLDVRIAGGRIAEIGVGLTGGPELDGRGGALIPGLNDHHIHLMALAAQAHSVALDAAEGPGDVERLIRAAAAKLPPDGWLRVTGYHERMAGDLTRDELDRLVPKHRLRVQHQTGSLWTLNTPALDVVLSDDLPISVELDAEKRPTGRIWRGDAWLRGRLGGSPPGLADTGAKLASYGVTGLMDASVTTDQDVAALLAAAGLPLRLALMSGGDLTAPKDGAFAVGPVKILLDDHDLPDLGHMGERIAFARSRGRAVAVHCVTAGELALTLAAFESFGARPGDRVEHGGMIPREAISVLSGLGLAVVTQPAFVFERGDRYLADIDTGEHEDIYRCASLIEGGLSVAASSDAPYAAPDPWAAMRAAVHRRTRAGRPIGPAEAVTPERALALFLGDLTDPGGSPRRVAVDAGADLCLLKVPQGEALEVLDAGLVAATLVAGEMVFKAGSALGHRASR